MPVCLAYLLSWLGMILTLGKSESASGRTWGAVSVGTYVPPILVNEIFE